MKIEEISRRKNPVNREKSLQSRISFCKAQQLKLSYLGKLLKNKIYRLLRDNYFWNLLLRYLIKTNLFFRYTVSAETGYVAEVSYEGTPVYPPAPEPKKPLTE